MKRWTYAALVLANLVGCRSEQPDCRPGTTWRPTFGMCVPLCVPDASTNCWSEDGGYVSDDASLDVASADAADTGSTARPVRLVAPMSTSTVTSRRPTLRFALPSGSASARIDLCRDRACSQVIESIDGASTVRPASELPSGWVFWRARPLSGSSPTGASSHVWQFWVNRTSAPIDTSYGSKLDVNGDGFVDLVVASAERATTRGSIQVFHGGPAGLSTTAARTIQGTADREGFGSSVASAGDVNGDGFGDVIVSAGSTGGFFANGKLFVYFGSASGIGASADWSYEATASRVYVGRTVAGIGDVNGDGFGDIAAGAPRDTADGAAYVFYGSESGFSARPSVLLNSLDARFGWAITGAGDCNGDGFADLAVTADVADNGAATRAGSVSLYHGSLLGLSTTPTFVWRATTADALMGYDVSSGDINGDGYSDLAVSGTLGGEAGTVIVLAGSAAGVAATPSSTIHGDSVGEALGRSVASGSDINGDGFDDLVVSGDGMMGLGVARVYFGSATGLRTPAVLALAGRASEGVIGPSVSTAGDFNGDFFADIAIAAPGNAVGGVAGAGVVRIHSGAAALSATPSAELRGSTADQWFGDCVSR